ncbi:Arm DNA-binding domain-containing protein [Pararhodobacter aggregans]|uniref:Arm DNA-binding domain-containing protein n=1 Tax=Pararhodobacter aggregans TaxID=404875 RepID=UPI003A8FF273
MRLTDIGIRSLAIPAKGQKTYVDDTLPGFGVRVSQGGAKSFVVTYGARRQLKTLGRYPDKSLKDARNEARVILGSGQV